MVRIVALCVCAVMWVLVFILSEMHAARAASVLRVIAVLLSIVLLFIAFDDVITSSYASKWSWITVILAVAVWGYWSYGTSSELYQCKKQEAENLNISFKKKNDIINRYLGDEISAFLDKHNMAEGYFTSVILEPAVRDKMKEYDALHRG